MNQASSYVVMKFGGTSVGSAARMEQVIDLVSGVRKDGSLPVVVLSAMSGVTNLLIEGAEKALARDLEGALSAIDKIRAKHSETICSLFSKDNIREELSSELEEKLNELAVLYKGVSYLGELSRRSLDSISGMGELLSSKIAAKLAAERGLASAWLDAREMVITDDGFGKARPLWDKLTPLCREKIGACLEENRIVFTQGFIGSTVNGINTTLGRGGSDYSASIIGVSIGAREIQIWTDVDGMLSADPRVVKNARILSEVSFQEASELAYFGAKVLHPMTIHPAVEKNIPVRILNTMNPSFAGTLIKSSVAGGELIRAVASKKNITSIYLHSASMLMSHGYLSRVFEIFKNFQIAVDLITTSEVSIALTIDTNDRLEELKSELSKWAEVQILKDLAIVSLVGRQIREQSGIAGRVFRALAEIPVLMISGGASDINLSFVVTGEHADEAVRRLHLEFFNC